MARHHHHDGCRPFGRGKFDPTVVNGGIIHAYGSNARKGEGEWMVVEADESDGTFNRLPATIAIITNIDPEAYGALGHRRGAASGLLRLCVQHSRFMGWLCAAQMIRTCSPCGQDHGSPCDHLWV